MSLLLEVMLGFGIFSTCLLMLFGIFPASYQTLAMARDLSMANNLARDKAENLRMAGYFDPLNSVGAHPAVPEQLFGMCVINGASTSTNFQRTWQVTQLDARTRQVVVTVAWTIGNVGSATGFNRQVQLETYVVSQD